MAVIPEFPDISSCTHFPLPESNWLEFKESFPCKLSYEKSVLFPLCGFLNTNGGYLVIGVVDADRRIKGVQTGKQLDAFLLKLDDIIRFQHIRPDNGSPLLHTNLSSYTLTSQSKSILVIKAVPTPGVQYYCPCEGYPASKIIRLSASNLRVSTIPTFVRADELTARVKERTIQFQAENTQLRVSLMGAEKRIKTLSSELNDVIGKAIELESTFIKVQQSSLTLQVSLHESVQLLQQTILQNKERKEKEIQSASSSWWNRLASAMCLL